MFTQYQEKAITGDFRIRIGGDGKTRFECRIIVRVTHRDGVETFYNTWRDAKEADFVLAEERARAA